MAWALLFAACALLSLELGETDSIHCYLCLMNYPGFGCITGGQKCTADLDRGQSCLTVHFFYQGTELYRSEGCTRPDVKNCGIDHTVGDYTVQMRCCTDREMCNRVFWNDTDFEDCSL